MRYPTWFIVFLCILLSACGSGSEREGSQTASTVPATGPAPTTAAPPSAPPSAPTPSSPHPPSAQATAPSAIPAGNVSRDFTATVGGIDVNGNGVRDDIEQFIEATYPEPFQRAAMMQYAKSFQVLIDAKSRESAVVAEQAVYRALDCTKKAFGKEWYKLTPDVRAMTLNTYQRVMAYAEAEKLGSGWLYKIYFDQPCDSK